MKFEELKKKDKFNAFESYMSVIEAKETGVIPPAYKTIFTDHCQCGSENIIRLTPDSKGVKKIKAVQCCDPRCYIKLAGNLAYFVNKLGINGFGTSSAISVIKILWERLEHKSHLDVFLLPLDSMNFLTSTQYNALAQVHFVLNGRKFSLSELLSCAAIPQWDASIKEVMQNYSDMDAVIDDIELNHGIPGFLAQFGIHSTQKMFYFHTYLPDMCIAESLIKEDNLRSKPEHVYKICMTGSLVLNGSRITKDRFLALLNDISTAKNGVQLFEFVKTDGPVNALYVVADAVSSSAKYLAGKRCGNLITSSELYEKISKAVNEYNEAIEQQTSE